MIIVQKKRSMFDCFLSIWRSYGVNDFLEDLRTLYRTAGQLGKGVTFIFMDSDVKEPAFLEYMNNMLASGMVNILCQSYVDCYAT